MPHIEPSLIDRRLFLRGAAATGAGFALGGLPLPAAATGAERWRDVEALIAPYVQDRRVANVVCALGVNGQPTDFIARGRDSFFAERLADPDSLYRIYSMTKPVTGMAAMILCDEGRIALDQPVAELLPAFAQMEVQKQADGPITEDNLEPAERPITIRHLLTHTAGLGYGRLAQQGPIAEAYLQRGLVPAQVSRLELPGMMRGSPAPSLEAFADALAQLPLVYQPGTRWSYSVGLDLMGRVIEVASGQSFDSFLQERIFDPCAMASTWFQVPEAEKFRFTANYFVLNGEPVPIDLPGNSVFLDKPPFPFGGAGLVSSPRDYDRFLAMLAGGGAIEGRRVMSEQAVRLGTSNLLPDTVRPGSPIPDSMGFGAGGRVSRDGALYGWFGAAGTTGFVDMARGLRMAEFTQYMPAQAYGLPDDFLAAALADARRIAAN
ncbi:serine hydrolase [Altererythrobacter sp. B11]|uniref:serine hydrolase domain-containing protein n=1 Tax=Altererythrobacter sp. B11 TaxID=2060312 RepID=UPI000DC701F6|nr:serine hydrolase domain-containing protein [Altererythrobacter sp. B11]BBC72316.1 serine hydrolase [Altererythrobacter sp. B11]